MRALTDEQIAHLAYEVNRAYCEAIDDTVPLAWEDTAEEIRAGTIAGVRAHIEHGGLSAAKSHELWCAQRQKDGWTWGLKKNDEKKKHPNLLPFDQLPLAQRVKDYVFRRDGAHAGTYGALAHVRK